MKMRSAVPVLIVVLLASFWVHAQVRDYRPVTEAMLRNPGRGRLAELAAHRQRLGLQPARSDQPAECPASFSSRGRGRWTTRARRKRRRSFTTASCTCPSPRGVIQALDGATGDLIWEYRPEVEQAPSRSEAPLAAAAKQTDIPRLTQRPAAATAAGGGDTERGIQRNLAIFGDRIFGTTGDAHVIALDARTGKLVWDTTVADSKLGYGYTSGPIVVRGKVIAGIAGCSRYKEDVCFITGHDAATGKELWRTSTVARPGEPGGDTWGDLPLKFRGRQRRVDSRQLRSGREPRLLGHGAGQAVGASRARHRRRGPLHELDARARSRHREDEVVLPAPARRDAGHGRSVREHPDRHRRTKVALQDGQARRCSGSSIERPARSSTPRDLEYQTILDVNPETGKVTYRAGQDPGDRRRRSTCVRARPASRAGGPWRSARRRTRCTSR